MVVSSDEDDVVVVSSDEDEGGTGAYTPPAIQHHARKRRRRSADTAPVDDDRAVCRDDSSQAKALLSMDPATRALVLSLQEEDSQPTPAGGGGAAAAAAAWPSGGGGGGGAACSIAKVMGGVEESVLQAMDVATRRTFSKMVRAEEQAAALETARRKKQHSDAELRGLQLAQKLEKEQALRHARGNLSYEQVFDGLEQCQQYALQHVDGTAKGMHQAALAALQARVKAIGFDAADLDAILKYIADDAPIIIHMTEEVLRLLCKDPFYRTQFETGTSKGTLSTEKRQGWEDAMFGGAYDGAKGGDHPKYGCLNMTGDIAGVKIARGYGTLYMTLSAAVRHRTTFANQDTGGTAGKGKLATNRWYAHVLAEYTDDELQTVLGVSKLRGAPSDTFPQYKECQIHGSVSITHDVIALSIPGKERDASAALTANAATFQTLSGCNIMWQGDLLGE